MKIWTDKEIEALRAAAGKRTAAELAVKFRVSDEAVRSQARRHNISLRLADPTAAVRVEWTPERIARTRKLWADGWSAAQVAADIGGVTRNAVIGKVNRLRMTRSATTNAAVIAASAARRSAERRHAEEASARKRDREQAQSLAAAQKKAAAQPNHPPVLVVDNTAPFVPTGLERQLARLITGKHCRFPVGEATGADQLFCSDKPEPDCPYCTDHRRLAWRSVPTKPKELIRSLRRCM